MNIPEPGVGIIYFSGFEKILESNSDLIQVVEIEPQTFWYRNRSELGSFVFDQQVVDYLAGLDQSILFHGVGFPIGGIIPPNPEHIPCLKQMMEKLNPLWFSEHLSFNSVVLNGQVCNTNFLLPPLQTKAAIEMIAKNIEAYKTNFDLPFLFETGVNYLSPKKFEIEDGHFINAIAQKTDANILLDIHNLLANEKNGRQKYTDLIKQIDLDRVTQIHLAGGFYFNGYYLDAHSGVSSNEVLEIFEKTVKLLSNLKAVTFEMLPEYLTMVSEKSITIQLEKMNLIWEQRGQLAKVQKIKEPALEFNNIHKDEPAIDTWENTLGLMAMGREVDVQGSLYEQLKKDKGVVIIKTLVEKFRGSLIVSSLKLTCRYIMLTIGMDEFNNLLRAFWKTYEPKLFASDNGIAFAQYLLNEYKLTITDSLLKDLILYEYNSMLTVLDNVEREISLSFDPNEVVASLAMGKLPVNIKKANYQISIVPDDSATERVSSVMHT